ncbi:trypco2 family protein [Streptomyces sp. TRM70308]|uniref:trypco2 family protein n=1 Tax=Streptomyces sp. TRM70308 TaxID=3131932 RepID=UPI003D04432D
MAHANGSGGEWLDLADAVALLRDQIAEAQARIADPAGGGASHRGVLFTVGEITLELGLELTRTRGVNGGLRFGLAGVSGSKESAGKVTHTVIVRLQPRGPGGDIDIGDQE